MSVTPLALIFALTGIQGFLDTYLPKNVLN
jgi:hypothetical protein